MTARALISLDGTWTFAADPAGAGLAGRWFDKHGFDREVSVPSPWQLYSEDMRGYTGYAWYHRTFEVPAAWAEREVAIRFEAVDYEARVWVDGQDLGSHEGGYTPFELVVPPGSGVRHLVVRVYDPADNSEIPHGKQGSWYTRVSGPWQPVSLVARPHQHVTALRITPYPEEARAKADLEAQAPEGTTVTVRVIDPDETEVASFTATVQGGRLSETVQLAAVKWWTPDRPLLYRAVAELGSDHFEVTFGMRSVRYEDGMLLLNGEPLYVRGALDQAFYPETIYRAPSLEAIEAEIRAAKAMGINVLRKHIKLEDPRYLDACDRLGMLIWEEPACYAKHTPQARERFTREVEAMIHRDYNHPSIIIWSLYNEEWGLEWRLWRDEDKQAHVEALYEHARSLDASRPYCDNSGWAHVKTDINDYHRYFTAPDQIAAWKADLAHCLDAKEANFVAGKGDNAEGVPVIISEFGVWGLPQPSRITTWYGGRPWWFDARWAGHTEEFKYPATAFRAFEKYRLAPVFGSLDALCEATQWRMMRALKPIIEAMRQRPDLAGWVVTEFTDIEWESNGWLDYFRQPKAGHEMFAWFNGAIAVMAEPNGHNHWSGEPVALGLWLSNHTGEELAGKVRWQLRGFDGVSDEAEVSVTAYGTEFFADAATFAAPAVAGTQRAVLAFEFVADDGRVLARNEEELTFTAREAALATGLGPVSLRGGAAKLASALGDAPLTPASLLVTTSLDAEARAHLAAGGRALFIAEEGEGAPERGLISFRRLPRGESWDRASSVFYMRPDKAGDLPLDGLLGWEMEDLFPNHVVPLSGYLQDFGGRLIELPSNQEHVDPEGVWAGYFEGWLGKFGAAVLRMPYEEGDLCVTTFRLLEHYGTHPVGTRLLHQLIAQMAVSTGSVSDRLSAQR